MAEETVRKGTDRAARDAKIEAAREAERLASRRRSTAISMLATVIAAIGAMFSVAILLTESLDRKDPLSSLLEPASRRTERQLLDQRRQLEQLRIDLQKALSTVPQVSGAPPKAAEMVALTKRVDTIEAEQRRLSAIISESPEKAVAIPLMRREIDDVKGSQAQVADALKREIDRIYDLNKWIIGGLAVGVLGLLVRDIFRSRGQPTDAKTS